MADYRAPVKDALFALRHIGMLDELAKTEPLRATPTSRRSTPVLEEHGRFMHEVFAPTNAVGDREGLTWSPDGVTTPESFKGAYAKFVEAGWQGLVAEPEYGGAGFPETVVRVAMEFMTAANARAGDVPGPDQRRHRVPPGMGLRGAEGALPPQAGDRRVDRHHEPDRAPGRLRRRAGHHQGRAAPATAPTRSPAPRSSSSFGEHDLAENIIHLVLARTPEAPPGTKGISLFIVPKFLVNDDGSLGERNDVKCVSIEHKMGIHASPTCVMSYGDDGGAIGYLVGEENQGMRAMFTMMNSARLAVGVQGVAIGDAAYQKALAYAQERKQGREIGGASQDAALIIEHPDVRRMLLFMRSHLEAMRNADHLQRGGHSTWPTPSRATTAERWQRDRRPADPGDQGVVHRHGRARSPRPRCRSSAAWASSRRAAWPSTSATCASRPIYEGTNGIQAMDLVGRKLPMRMGGVVDRLHRPDALDSTTSSARPATSWPRSAPTWPAASTCWPRPPTGS